jgi:hypothetical protein
MWIVVLLEFRHTATASDFRMERFKIQSSALARSYPLASRKPQSGSGSPEPVDWLDRRSMFQDLRIGVTAK